jgi:hypothetical protein
MLRALEPNDLKVLGYIVAEYILLGDLPPVNGGVRRWVLHNRIVSRFHPETEFSINWSLYRLMENDYIRKVNDDHSYYAGEHDMYLPTNKGMMILWVG